MASLYKLLIQILGVNKASPALKQVSKDVQATKTAASGLTKALETLGAIGFGYMGREAIQAIWDFGALGAESLRLKDTFHDLAGAAGDDLVRAIKAASGGTITALDAMGVASKGMVLELGANIEEWGQLTEVARFKARTMQKDVTEALSGIVTAIGKESEDMLENQQVVIDTERVLENYARSVHKTEEALTSAERKHAIMAATIKSGQKDIAAAGGLNDDFKDSIDRVGVAFDEFKTKAAEDFAPAVATIADKVTEALPKLEATIFQLWALARAIDAANRAAFHGGDAQKAFETSIRQSIGAVAEVNQEVDGWYAAMHGWPDNLGPAIDATNALTVSVYGLNSAILQTLSPAGELINVFQDEAYAANLLAIELDELRAKMQEVSKTEILGGFESTAGQVESRIAALAGIVDKATLTRMYDDYVDELQALYRNASSLTDFELAYRVSLITNRLDDEINVFKDAARKEKELMDEMKRAYEDLRSTVEAALQPTKVTGLDVAQTAAGTYEEKWDENARRLDAIAARGFEELEAHPDWAELLKIPPDVLAGGEDVLKGWAQQTADDVRNLFRPDLLNIPAAVEAVKQALQNEAAKQLSLDIITEAVLADPTVKLDPNKAKKQVAAALGLDQTFIGEEAGAQFMSGLTASLQDTSLSAEFASYMQKDVSDGSGQLKDSGDRLWGVVELGILEAMRSTDYVHEFAMLLAPEVARIIQSWSERTGQ